MIGLGFLRPLVQAEGFEVVVDYVGRLGAQGKLVSGIRGCESVESGINEE